MTKNSEDDVFESLGKIVSDLKQEQDALRTSASKSSPTRARRLRAIEKVLPLLTLALTYLKNSAGTPRKPSLSAKATGFNAIVAGRKRPNKLAGSYYAANSRRILTELPGEDDTPANWKTTRAMQDDEDRPEAAGLPGGEDTDPEPKDT